MGSIIRTIIDAVSENDSDTIAATFGKKGTRITEFRVTESGRRLPLCPDCKQAMLEIDGNFVCPKCHYTE